MKALAIVTACPNVTVCSGYAQAYGELTAACTKLDLPFERHSAPTLDITLHIALTRGNADRILIIDPMVEWDHRDVLAMAALDNPVVGIAVPRPRYEWDTIKGAASMNLELSPEVLATVPQVDIQNIEDLDKPGAIPTDAEMLRADKDGLVPVKSIEPLILAVDRQVFEAIFRQNASARIKATARNIEYELVGLFFSEAGFIAETPGQRFCRLAREVGYEPKLFTGTGGRVANSNLWGLNCFRGNIGALVEP